MHQRAQAGPQLGRRALFTAAAVGAASGLVGCFGIDDEQQPRRSAGSSATDRSPQPPAAPTPRPTEAEAGPPKEATNYEKISHALEDRTPQEWGVAPTGVITSFSAAGSQAVLTLDACGGPNGSDYDQRLIEALRRTTTPATLFINQRWARTNPITTQELIDDPLFEIANHGTRHQALSVSGRSAYGLPGTASLRKAYHEVVDNFDFFRATYGSTLKHFRPGSAHSDEVAAEMVTMLGHKLVNFSINADGGATYSAEQVRQTMAATSPGDIIIGHFNRPGSGTAAGMEAALAEAAQRGIEWTTLAETIGGDGAS